MKPHKPAPFVAIAAMSLNRVIGNKGALPWQLPEDMRFFKATTMGHVLIMGRKTFESIGRPLPGRETIVVSRTLADRPGIRVVRDPDEIDPDDYRGKVLFIAGGGELYARTVSRWHCVFLTLVKREVEGDVVFPKFESAFPEPSILHEFDTCWMLLYSTGQSAFHV